jgi:MtN3 and saliva related transmembrane protein
LGMAVTLMSAVGFGAAFCTTFALVPQVLKAWRSRSTADVSMGWIAVLSTGTLLWFIYGVMGNDAPLITANATSFVLAAAILVLKLRHG